jgi:hypothetical protein
MRQQHRRDVSAAFADISVSKSVYFSFSRILASGRCAAMLISSRRRFLQMANSCETEAAIRHCQRKTNALHLCPLRQLEDLESGERLRTRIIDRYALRKSLRPEPVIKSELLSMMNALTKFFRRISDVVRAPSYSADTQKKHEEKEQMSQPQEEFIDSKSNSTKSGGPVEPRKRT